MERIRVWNLLQFSLDEIGRYGCAVRASRADATASSPTLNTRAIGLGSHIVGLL